MLKIIEATRYFVEGHDAAFATRTEAELFAIEESFQGYMHSDIFSRYADVRDFKVFLKNNRHEIAGLMGWEIHDAK